MLGLLFCVLTSTIGWENASEGANVADAPLIVGIGGSNGSTSTTNRLLSLCLDRARDRGARTVQIAGPALAALPIYGTHDATTTDVEAELIDSARQADGLVIATPGYHGGMSGLVKNAIDHLEALREDARPYLDGRAVGVIVSAAGWQACGTTVVSVRSTIHALRGWPTPFGVTVNSAVQKPDAAGRFDETVEGALDILAGQVVDFASWQVAARS